MSELRAVLQRIRGKSAEMGRDLDHLSDAQLLAQIRGIGPGAPGGQLSDDTARPGWDETDR